MTSPHDSGAGSPACETPVGTRRKFFVWVTRAAAGLIGLGLAVPLLGYVISPALKRRVQSWVEVTEADKLPAGEPKQLDCVMTLQDGYISTTAHKAVWAIKQTDGQVTVFSPMCPHLGCGYHWDASDRKFKCPCHGSVYDISGKVLAGPAPRPLDALPSKVEDGKLLVMYKEFRSGAKERIEL